MNPVCKFNINPPECQRWMNEVYDRCRELLLHHDTPITPYSLWRVYKTPATYKEVNVMTALDCHKLKRELDREVDIELEALTREDEPPLVLGITESVVAILILIIIWTCIKRCWRLKQVSEHVGGGGGPADRGGELEEHKGKEPNIPILIAEQGKKNRGRIRKWMRRCCRPVFLHSDKQMKEFELATERQVASHNERLKLKIAMWTKAQKRDAEKMLQMQQPGGAANKNYKSFVPQT